MSETKLKLGSLFDGIGGFPLAASWYGIEPVWASEVEPACIRITKRHFPNMRQLGDITKIHGDQIEPVDVITGGSPCPDLSVAGKQSGIKLKCENCGTLVEFSDSTQKCPNCGTVLELTRSGLFMEQIRIIREMREKTNECYPKIVIWENVAGALSSNKGDDFFCVLREFCKLMAERIPTFRPEKWTNAGEMLGESLTHNIGEFPSVAVESSLSQILQDNALEKYSLSMKACAGILRRAQSRGKNLHPRLKRALENQVRIGQQQEETM